MPAEGRAPTLRPRRPANQRWEEPVSEAKPFDIPKRLVWDAYQRVKANHGAAGVDGETLALFEQDLKGNLYKIWNRMASGSYHPPPVRLVEIPKATGGTRPLGIPTVADRVAQTVVTMVLEPVVEPHFPPDSYAYRPGRSALDAVGTARKRCWRTDWVIDLDIKAFFESMPRDLIERAIAHHTDLAWVKLYEHIAFDFLGYTFQPRRVKNRWGRYFVSFLPAISPKAATAIRQTICGWRMASTRNNQ